MNEMLNNYFLSLLLDQIIFFRLGKKSETWNGKEISFYTCGINIKFLRLEEAEIVSRIEMKI